MRAQRCGSRSAAMMVGGWDQLTQFSPRLSSSATSDSIEKPRHLTPSPGAVDSQSTSRLRISIRYFLAAVRSLPLEPVVRRMAASGASNMKSAAGMPGKATSRVCATCSSAL